MLLHQLAHTNFGEIIGSVIAAVTLTRSSETATDLRTLLSAKQNAMPTATAKKLLSTMTSQAQCTDTVTS